MRIMTVTFVGPNIALLQFVDRQPTHKLYGDVPHVKIFLLEFVRMLHNLQARPEMILRRFVLIL